MATPALLGSKIGGEHARINWKDIRILAGAREIGARAYWPI